jgi:hypothetical protein
MKNLTYDQLIELAPKDRPFQIEVDSNAQNDGGKQVLWANIFKGQLDTCMLEQDDIDNVRYDWFNYTWRDDYKGTFTLIDPRYQKPEVLKVGQKVRIMESARSHSDKELIGKIFTIDFVRDNNMGVYYEIDMYKFPHYCVMPVEEEEEPERTIEDILSELSDTDKEIIKSKLK